MDRPHRTRRPPCGRADTGKRGGAVVVSTDSSLRIRLKWWRRKGPTIGRCSESESFRWHKALGAVRTEALGDANGNQETRDRGHDASSTPHQGGVASGRHAEGRKAHSWTMTSSYTRGDSISGGAWREHIERALVAYGATDVLLSHRGNRSAIAFRGDGRKFRIVVSLPQPDGISTIRGTLLRAPSAKQRQRPSNAPPAGFGKPWPWP